MKQVILQELAMRNFRGEKERTTRFDEKETTIMGANGLGKTRHFDAFVWLLFGKDTQDRKDYNIKTVVNGEPLQRVNTEVSCTLLVDGEKVNLRRVYAEKWRKPRGQAEEVFDGHEHELFWNDVPLKLGEYNSRINSIIEDSIFKMITNPLFFANMKWQDQREVLFQLAGTVTDQEIAEKDPEYAALLDRISGKSFGDFKRELLARKRKLKEQLEGIQPRIDQTQKLMPEAVDFGNIEAEITGIDEQIAKIDLTISDRMEAVKQQQEEVLKKQEKLGELQQQRQEVLNAARLEAQKKSFDIDAHRKDLERVKEALITETSTLISSLNKSKREVDENNALVERLSNEIAEKRQEWMNENALEYQGGDTCHTCNQPLPNDMLNSAKELFMFSKAKKLEELNLQGGNITKEIKQKEERNKYLVATIEHLQTQISAKKSEVSKLDHQIAEQPEAKEQVVDPLTIPQWVELSKEVDKIHCELTKNHPTPDTTELQEQKKGLTDKRNNLKDELKNRELIIRYEEEIASLQNQGKELAQQLADAESEEYTMQQFTKAKITESEKRINELFSMVTFRLFEYTLDGNEVETCIPLVNGVPFGTANTAGQINAGLDIINALVQYHGVSAPIFIDRRESVNQLAKTKSQIINLVVSNDKELIVK